MYILNIHVVVDGGSVGAGVVGVGSGVVVGGGVGIVVVGVGGSVVDVGVGGVCVCCFFFFITLPFQNSQILHPECWVRRVKTFELTDIKLSFLLLFLLVYQIQGTLGIWEKFKSSGSGTS